LFRAVDGLEISVGSAQLLHLPEIVEDDLDRPVVTVLLSSLGGEESVGKVGPPVTCQTPPEVFDPLDSIDDTIV
jgi:hypothetical protein